MKTKRKLPTRPMTTTEAADWLKVKRDTLQKWIKHGKLPAAKVGRDYLIEPVDLEEFRKTPRQGKGRPKKEAKP